MAAESLPLRAQPVAVTVVRVRPGRRAETTEAEHTAETAAPAPARAPAQIANLLAMQQGIGNAAVARMLAREPEPAVASDEGKRERAPALRPADQKLKDTVAERKGTISNAFGTFTYAIKKNAGANGCSFHCEFAAFSPEQRADKITFIQTVKSWKGEGELFYLNNNSAYYADFDPDGSGTYTDHLPGETDPFYNYEDKTSTDETTGTTGKTKTTMDDGPKIGSIAGKRGQTFETAPFALSGTDKGDFYGTLTWGWKVDDAGNFELEDVAVHDDITTTYGAALRKFIGAMHDKNKTGTTPAKADLELPSDKCRELKADERLKLKPIIDYVKGKPNARVWVVGRHAAGKNASLDDRMDEYNGRSVEGELVAGGLSQGIIRTTHLVDSSVAKDVTALEITVIDS